MEFWDRHPALKSALIVLGILGLASSLGGVGTAGAAHHNVTGPILSGGHDVVSNLQNLSLLANSEMVPCYSSGNVLELKVGEQVGLLGLKLGSARMQDAIAVTGMAALVSDQGSVFVSDGKIMRGDVALKDGDYTLTAKRDVCELIKVDPEAKKPDVDIVIKGVPIDGEKPVSMPVVEGADENLIIDLVAPYTNELVAKLGGETATRAEVAKRIADAQLQLENSGIYTTTLRTVYMGPLLPGGGNFESDDWGKMQGDFKVAADWLAQMYKSDAYILYVAQNTVACGMIRVRNSWDPAMIDSYGLEDGGEPGCAVNATTSHEVFLHSVAGSLHYLGEGLTLLPYGFAWKDDSRFPCIQTIGAVACGLIGGSYPDMLSTGGRLVEPWDPLQRPVGVANETDVARAFVELAPSYSLIGASPIPDGAFPVKVWIKIGGVSASGVEVSSEGIPGVYVTSRDTTDSPMEVGVAYGVWTTGVVTARVLEPNRVCTTTVSVENAGAPQEVTVNVNTSLDSPDCVEVQTLYLPTILR
jgi:hypothetical protein